MKSKSKYIVGCDFANRPNWFYRQMFKIGLFKDKRKDYSVLATFKIHEDGSVEHIKTKRL